MNNKKNKMTVEIWSDVMCPFCYIGKRRFEAALAPFKSKENVEVVWKSFQLAPDLITDASKNAYDYLAEKKGMTIAEAKDISAYVTEMAAEIGLVYDFDKSVVANSFKAHRFTHFAKLYGKQDEAEEKLFEAYFTLGLNIDDDQVLLKIATAIGLDASLLAVALANNYFAEEVQNDIYEAGQVGVKGVPFFVFDRKYAISGAQEISIFEKTLNKSFEEWEPENTIR